MRKRWMHARFLRFKIHITNPSGDRNA